jgi:hypothetical protein
LKTKGIAASFSPIPLERGARKRPGHLPVSLGRHGAGQGEQILMSINQIDIFMMVQKPTLALVRSSKQKKAQDHPFLAKV